MPKNPEYKPWVFCVSIFVSSLVIYIIISMKYRYYWQKIQANSSLKSIWIHPVVFVYNYYQNIYLFREIDGLNLTYSYIISYHYYILPYFQGGLYSGGGLYSARAHLLPIWTRGRQNCPTPLKTLEMHIFQQNLTKMK